MIHSSPFHESVWVAEEDLLPRSYACPLCGLAGSRVSIQTLQSAPVVELLKCPACQGASASRMPRAPVLASYYASYYDDSASGVTVHDERRAGAHLARALGAPASRRNRLLDFGAGDGSLAEAVARYWLDEGTVEHVELTLVDPTPPGVSSSSGIAVRHRTELSDDGQRYDRIIASAILEHVPRPGDTLTALVERLAIGGRLYARTPWVEWFARMLPGFDVGFPAHLHDLGPAWWSRVCDLYGLPAHVRISRTSFVESSFRRAPLRALIAGVAKAPSIAMSRCGLPGEWWPWVGGWEVVIERDAV